MRIALVAVVLIVCSCTQAQTPPIETQPPASSAATQPATTAPASPTEPAPVVEPANPAPPATTTSPSETTPARPVAQTPSVPPGETTPQTPVTTPAPETPTPTPTPTPATPPVVAGQPLPGAPAMSPVNTSCKIDSDCAVKNVGNCCGYYPRCVNKSSPTYPEQVKAKCAAEGMASVCGFQELSGCTCESGTCQGVSTPGGDSPK